MRLITPLMTSALVACVVSAYLNIDGTGIARAPPEPKMVDSIEERAPPEPKLIDSIEGRAPPEPKQVESNSTNSAFDPATNAEICDCMVASLTCVANNTISADTISADEADDFFKHICASLDQKACGVIGFYDECNNAQKLNYRINQIYLDQYERSCPFPSQAVSTKLPSTACKNFVLQTATSGTGNFTAPDTIDDRATSGAAGGRTMEGVMWTIAAAYVVGVAVL